MSTDLARPEYDDRAITRPDAEHARVALAHLSATGDVSRMTVEQRGAYILWYCERIGLTPGTGAVEIIEFWDEGQKRNVAKVYPKAAAAQQLGYLHRIRVETLSEEMVGNGLYKVAVRGHSPDGRTYDEVGYVSLTDGQGNRLSNKQYKNALMKCHTVAKRRLILAMIGLSSPPEGGRRLYLGPSGEILDAPTEEDRHLNDHPNEAAVSGQPRFETMPAPPTDLDDAPDLRPTPEHLEHPARPPGPRPSFKRAKEDIDRLCGGWFAAVKGSSLDDDDARHRFVAQWTATAGWQKARQCSSIRDFMARATDREAGDLLAHVRALVADERRANQEALADAGGSRTSTSDEGEEEEPF